MIIKNKLESIKKIEELNLNRFPEKLFEGQDDKQVKQFISKYPSRYYAIRDKKSWWCF